MKNLYVLGNGFDLHHGLNTSYQSFAEYLYENEDELYEDLIRYFKLVDLVKDKPSDEEWDKWSYFEETLARLNYFDLLDEYSDLIVNISDPNYTIGDEDYYAYQIEEKVNMLTKNLINEFNNFILSLDYRTISSALLIRLEKDNHFLSFNYTETLQKSYNIPEDRITYIHNKASPNNCNLILGHGINPIDFNEKEELHPKFQNREMFEIWAEEEGNKYNRSRDLAMQKAKEYFTISFKNTSKIIDDRKDFFSMIKGIEQIFVLGHSIAEVDIEYFKALKKNISDDVIWHVSFFNNGEDTTLKQKLVQIGINEQKVIPIKINSLVNLRFN